MSDEGARLAAAPSVPPGAPAETEDSETEDPQSSGSIGFLTARHVSIVRGGVAYSWLWRWVSLREDSSAAARVYVQSAVHQRALHAAAAGLGTLVWGRLG